MISSSPPSARTYAVSVDKRTSSRRSIFEIAAWRMSSSPANCSCVTPKLRRNSASAKSATIVFVRARAFDCRAGGIFLRNTSKDLAISSMFLLKRSEVVAVNSIGERTEHVVPAAIAGLVSTHEQQGHTARIKCVEHAQRPPPMLDPELAHMPMARPGDAGTVRKG